MNHGKRRIIDYNTTKHDRHNHHRAGAPPSEISERFPGIFYDDGASNIEVYGFGGYSHVRCGEARADACRCGRYACHIDSIILAVDGACPGNGTQAATKSAFGVYFGPSDTTGHSNWSFQIPDTRDYEHTNQRAELHGAIAGLRAAFAFVMHGGQWDCKPAYCDTPCTVKHVIIKTDSAYVVNNLTDSTPKWLANGWLTAKKTPVKNRDLWTELLARRDAIQRKGVIVNFWHVAREMNREADQLAKAGLDGTYFRDGDYLKLRTHLQRWWAEML